VKITVIATGFDRIGAVKQQTASAAVTPVDLSSYTAYQVPEKIAAVGGGSSISLGGGTVAPAGAGNGTGAGGPRLTLSRRPVLEMPITNAAADPAIDTFSPGAEFEPVSPLDVPAFLRRQNEG
jgi:hypothetical protein